MNPAVNAIVRGLHDLFAATWAGGLLVMALVVFPTLRSMRAGARAPSAGPATSPETPGVRACRSCSRTRYSRPSS